MPRYYFHVRDGKTLIDDQGVELASLDDAKREALRLAGAILMNEKPVQIWTGQIWKIEVSFDQSPMAANSLFALTVTGTENVPD